MARDLSDYKVLTFDCYGTLIDWESGIWDALQPLWRANGCELEREPALQTFSNFESAQQAATPDMIYPELLTRVHRAIADKLDLSTSEEMDRRFGHSVPYWPAFPDSADALRRLKRHYKLVILSNVDRAGFAASNDRLGVDFDAIYTAEDVGSYKPNPANFEFMLSALDRDLGLGPDDILHTAQSLFHDHVQATRFGLATCWIDRQGLSEGDKWGATAIVEDRPEVDFLFPTLAAMADARSD